MTVRKITLTLSKGDSWKIQEGDKYVDWLGWDEMLGSIAQLTHPKIGVTQYPMLTRKEHAAQRKMHIDRIKELKQTEGK
jgi:hypothetical protein